MAAIRSLTTEATEAAEAGKKGFRSRIRTLPSFRSVSVLSVLSVVKFGANPPKTMVITHEEGPPWLHRCGLPLHLENRKDFVVHDGLSNPSD